MRYPSMCNAEVAYTLRASTLNDEGLQACFDMTHLMQACNWLLIDEWNRNVLYMSYLIHDGFMFQAFSQESKNSSPTDRRMKHSTLNSEGNLTDAQENLSTSLDSPSRNTRRQSNGNSTPIHGTPSRKENADSSSVQGTPKGISPRNRFLKCKQCHEMMVDKCEFSFSGSFLTTKQILCWSQFVPFHKKKKKWYFKGRNMPLYHTFQSQFVERNDFFTTWSISTKQWFSWCPKCVVKLNNNFFSVQLETHMALKHVKKMYTCDGCNFKTSSEHHLQNHKVYLALAIFLGKMLGGICPVTLMLRIHCSLTYFMAHLVLTLSNILVSTTVKSRNI